MIGAGIEPSTCKSAREEVRTVWHAVYIYFKYLEYGRSLRTGRSTVGSVTVRLKAVLTRTDTSVRFFDTQCEKHRIAHLKNP
jgi:hypothetical protein